MKLQKIFVGKSKLLLMGALMLLSFFILLPNFVYVVQWQQAPFTSDEVVITNVCYKSEATQYTDENIIAGLLFQPSPKFSDKDYPAVIACHGFLGGAGKESMNRWCVEVAKRGFVVLSIDLPGHGMSLGEMDILPRNTIEPHIISDGIEYLQGQNFVDDSKIGLMGISYGGATVSLSSGVLGDKIDATVSMNGFTNLTHWLIYGILPEQDVTFSVNEKTIELQTVGDKEFTPNNIRDLLRAYELYRGDDQDIEDLIVSGTTKLDRNFLKKFDAVEYLPNVKNQSIMFIDSQRQGTFDHTNQSMLGYQAVINAGKDAYYVPVNDNHQLMDDPDYTSDYCIINFFEERLKGVDLGEIGEDHSDAYHKYSQKRDIDLTYSKVFGFELLYECIGRFFLSFLPIVGIVLIIVYNKKIATKRAQKEEEILKAKQENEDFIDLSFGRGSFPRTLLYLFLLYIIAYLTMVVGSLGFFSPLIIGTLCASFYFVMYLLLYYIPDQAEIELWARKDRKDESKRQNEKKIKSNDYRRMKTRLFDINALYILIALIGIALIVSIVGFSASLFPQLFHMPLEPIFWTMLITGASLLIFAILIMWIFAIWERNGEYTRMRREGKGNLSTLRLVNWEQMNLSKYSLVKTFAFGSILFLAFFFQWNIWTFYMKFPMMIVPHSLYFMFMAVSVLLFFGGGLIFINVFKEKFLMEYIQTEFPDNPRKGIFRMLLIEGLAVVFGLFLFTIVGIIAFYPILSSSLFGFLGWALVGVFIALYLVISVLEFLYPDKSQFAVSLFFPLFVFTIAAYFLHI